MWRPTGCPLAPLLFILAMDTLYRRVEARKDIAGLIVPTSAGGADTRIAGYADDTALHVRDCAMIPAALEEVGRFGTASGLRANVSKSVVLPLGEAVRRALNHVPDAPHVLAEGTACRYLGVQVGGSNTIEANWGAMISGFRCRLRFAIGKTHTTMQRAEIARAIIVPKVLYVARHSWSPATTVDALQCFVRAFVWGSNQGKRRCAWMGAKQAELPTAEDGLGIPNIQLELVAMASMAVGCWASDSSELEWGVGDVLLNPGAPRTSYVMPTPVPSRSWADSMWRAGVDALREALWMAPTSSEKSSVSKCTAAVLRRPDNAVWVDDTLVVDVRHLLNGALLRRQVDCRGRGRVCTGWLRHCLMRQDGWLLDRNGQQMHIAGLSTTRGDAALGDTVTWDWKEASILRFAVIDDHHIAAARKCAWLRFCVALVFNFPDMLYRPAEELELRPYSEATQQHHDWNFGEGETITHKDAEW